MSKMITFLVLFLFLSLGLATCFTAGLDLYFMNKYPSHAFMYIIIAHACVLLACTMYTTYKEMLDEFESQKG